MGLSTARVGPHYGSIEHVVGGDCGPLMRLPPRPGDSEQPAEHELEAGPDCEPVKRAYPPADPDPIGQGTVKRARSRAEAPVRKLDSFVPTLRSYARQQSRHCLMRYPFRRRGLDQAKTRRDTPEPRHRHSTHGPANGAYDGLAHNRGCTLDEVQRHAPRVQRDWRAGPSLRP